MSGVRLTPSEPRAVSGALAHCRRVECSTMRAQVCLVAADRFELATVLAPRVVAHALLAVSTVHGVVQGIGTSSWMVLALSNAAARDYAAAAAANTITITITICPPAGIATRFRVRPRSLPERLRGTAVPADQ